MQPDYPIPSKYICTCVTSTRGFALPSLTGDAWRDAELLNTIAESGGAGDDASQAHEVRFLRGVAKLVKRRLNMHDGDDNAPAVFFLQPTLPPNTSTLALDFHPMLDNGETLDGGRAWFVGPVVLSGRSAHLPWESDEVVFALVVDQLSLGDVPAVIFDPRPDVPEVRFYRKGLGEPDSCDVVSIEFGAVHLDAVLDVVDRVHRRQLVAPDAQSQMGKLWQNKAKHRVAAKAELIIQMYLETALNAAFPTCTIRSEQPQVSGRLDIEIEEPDENNRAKIIRHALLELKVLRSFGSTGESVSVTEVLSWITEGIEQAHSYRVDRGTAASALCCFDMRKKLSGTVCFESVRDRAGELEVTLRVWHLFASAKAYRKFASAESADVA